MITLFYWMRWFAFRRTCPECGGGRNVRRAAPNLLFGGRESAYYVLPCPERFHDRVVAAPKAIDNSEARITVLVR